MFLIILICLILIVFITYLFSIKPLQKSALKRIEKELILDEEILMTCEKFMLIARQLVLTNKGIIFAFPHKVMDDIFNKFSKIKTSILYEEMHEADFGRDIKIILKDGNDFKLKHFKDMENMFKIIGYYVKHPKETM